MLRCLIFILPVETPVLSFFFLWCNRLKSSNLSEPSSKNADVAFGGHVTRGYFSESVRVRKWVNKVVNLFPSKKKRHFCCSIPWLLLMLIIMMPLLILSSPELQLFDFGLDLIIFCVFCGVFFFPVSSKLPVVQRRLLLLTLFRCGLNNFPVEITQ